MATMSGNRSVSCTGLIAFLCILASCATGPAPSSVILARAEPPLLDVPVLFQRMMGADSDPSANVLDQRAMPRRLVATARELTMPGGNGNALTPWEFTLSFSTVDSVEVKTITYDPLGFMGKSRSFDGAVTIRDQRGRCMSACVFLFVDEAGEPDPGTAHRFADIVRAGRASIDAFGRDDGPRPVAVAFGLRAPRPVWHQAIRDEHPDTRKIAGDIESAALRYAGSGLRSDYQETLTSRLNADAASGAGMINWSFSPVSDLTVNRATELNVAAVRNSEQLQRLATNSLLVSDIYGLGFTYVPPQATDPARVQTTFRAFVDFYDLEPMKDGRYFWFDLNLQRPMAEFAADPVASLRQDIGQFSAALAARIKEEIGTTDSRK